MAKKYIDAKWHYPQKGEYPVIYGEYEHKHYPQIPCLVFYHGMYGVRFWNCTEECWDDEECDDFYCSKEEVEKWMYIDSLEQEQPSEGYDEAYLNEKIAKASKTWKGVDVDKYMAEMRGYEQPSEDLEKEIERFLESEESTSYDNAGTYKVSFKDPTKIARHFYELGKQSKEPVSEGLEEEIKRYRKEEMPVVLESDLNDIARHFANWQKKQMPMPEDTVIFQKGIEEGKRLMMEEAVEGTYAVTTVGHFAFFTDKPIKDLCLGDGCGLAWMSFGNGSPGVCYISGLSVIPETTNLMRECENYCKQRGIFRIDLNSRKEGWLIGFYESLGYTQLFEEDGEMKMYKMLR